MKRCGVGRKGENRTNKGCVSHAFGAWNRKNEKVEAAPSILLVLAGNTARFLPLFPGMKNNEKFNQRLEFTADDPSGESPFSIIKVTCKRWNYVVGLLFKMAADDRELATLLRQTKRALPEMQKGPSQRVSSISNLPRVVQPFPFLFLLPRLFFPSILHLFFFNCRPFFSTFTRKLSPPEKMAAE